MNFKQDEKNWYYYGNTDIKAEETLKTLGFYYDRNEFDEFGNKFEVWVKNKTDEN